MIAGVLYRAFAVALLAGSASEVSAQTHADLQACAVRTQDNDKLKCFLDLANKGEERGAAAVQDRLGAPGTGSSWTFSESSSPLDDSKEVTAIDANVPSDGQHSGEAVVVRCKEHQTDFYIATTGYWGSSNSSSEVVYRINSDAPKNARWSPGANGKAVFYPGNARAFLQSLPEMGKLFVRVTGFDGQTYDSIFRLDGLAEVRSKVGEACNWSTR